MVEKRINNGRRIAELLASELEGLEMGQLVDISVVETNPEADPGDIDYGIAHEGQLIGHVRIRQDGAVITLDDGWPNETSTLPDGLRLENPDEMVVEYGAAVKRAVDAIHDALD